MEEVNQEAIVGQNFDHYGLLAAAAKELDLEEKINKRIGSKDPRRRVQPGTAVLALLMNGMGFFNRTIYLTPQFFKHLPIDTLLGKGLMAEDLTEQTLGRALDEIYEYDSSRFFTEIAMEIATENDLLSSNVRYLDTTSFSLSGLDYEKEGNGAVEAAYGYSKDYRPNALQLMMTLICNAKVPLYMQPLSGNASDKAAFPEAIERFNSFTKALKEGAEGNKDLWIADSAFYTKDNIQKNSQIDWISRVPETIKEAKELIAKPEKEILWEGAEDGYRFFEHSSDYADVKQTWILVSSKQAKAREAATLEKKASAQLEKAKKAVKHLNSQLFGCESDAKKALKKFKKTLPSYLKLLRTFKKRPVYAVQGRPKKTDKAVIKFVIQARVELNTEKLEKLKSEKGRFILATNKKGEQAASTLKSYKELQTVERGFRFLKDPLFMADQFFLKKTERLMALMSIMALMLFFNMYLQHKLRTRLVEAKEHVPNQKKKSIQNPTTRWVFSLFRGIIVFLQPVNNEVKRLIVNVNSVHKLILRLLGPLYSKMYGIIEAPS